MSHPHQPSEIVSPQLLEQLGIEPCFHELIVELCGGKREYLGDIEADDFARRTDASGVVIPPAVARGLVRKLRSSFGAVGDTQGNSDRGKIGTQESDSKGLETSKDAKSAAPCRVTLLRGDGDYASFVRCAVRGELDQDKVSKPKTRRKILTAILDNSGSMSYHWSLVVDAISKVFTDALLSDPFVTLKAIAYNTEASEVILPGNSAEISSLLLRRFSPRGITNFRSAFEMAESLIKCEVNRHISSGVPLNSIDVTTLIFTDGEDTSVPPLGYKTKAATEKARAAGDAFQEFLGGLGCPTFTSLAAFGEYHNPEQCQYLSDRYYYINRREVLSDWLMGGLADLLKSSGYCNLEVQLPGNLSLAEPLPKRIGLDVDSTIEYEIWLRDESCGTSSAQLADQDEVGVNVEFNGTVVLHGSVAVSSAAVIDSGSLEGHLFLLDAGEMQLRQIALELRGNRPSATELARLRERLMGVVALVSPVFDLASNPKERVFGRSVILARLEELETRRKRLSYTLGHFEEEKNGDTRNIGVVGIDAVLRDASQRVPLGAAAAMHARRSEAAMLLPAAEELSEYGSKSTFDPISACTAKQAADQGDSLFFRLGGVTFSDDGAIEAATDCGDQPVAHEVFMLLSDKGDKALDHPDNNGESFTHVGIPFFATSGHFLRAKLVLPDVLKRLSPHGIYTRGKSECLLLDLLGYSLAAQLRMAGNSSPDSLVLFHKARSVTAVLEDTESLSGAGSLLDEMLAEAKMFIDRRESRNKVKNLYGIAAAGLLAQEWSLDDLVGLGEAVVEESIRRAISRRLAKVSESERIRLAWAALGNGGGSNDGGSNVDAWLDCSLVSRSCGSWSDDFDIVAAGRELEVLEERLPGRYSPREPALLCEILGSAPPSGTPRIEEWGELLSLFSRWGVAVENGRKEGGLWVILDSLMTESAPNPETLYLLAVVLHPGQPAGSLRDVLPNPASTLCGFAEECMRGLEGKGNCDGLLPRLALASVVNAVVGKREDSARRFPIRGAAYPSRKPMKESDMHKLWGAEASPVDAKLYQEVRRSTHRKFSHMPLPIREALTDKIYRKQGGRFEFPTQLDTFIRGLHRRTRDLHDAWDGKGQRTDGPEAKEEAVKEMLLRLRWDDRDDRARAKLAKIVGSIWDGLEGLPPGPPIPSALWLDSGEEDSIKSGCGEKKKGGTSGRSRRETDEAGDEWDII